MRAGASGRLFFVLRACAPADDDKDLHWKQVQERRATSPLYGFLIEVKSGAGRSDDRSWGSFCGGLAAPREASDKILTRNSAQSTSPTSPRFVSLSFEWTAI